MRTKDPGNVSEQEILTAPWPDREIDKEFSLNIIRLYNMLPEEDRKNTFNDIHNYYQQKYPDKLGYIYYMKFIYDFLKILLGNLEDKANEASEK
ncbi:MAG: hypothetical protein DKM50_13825 [Candidatus Margulisiibacteriota bacterium]|nr:MAG: hypothetical protein A2X43_00860 [Candidatus Margulisbacteria bacterium GWD2_39_127]OGI02381.1 MAG: hypothetical protein A2X42_09510 [Candidatus Margulisbacteria bacterium GWF2_38_17]OGI08514.1 MAG: hypothetical protein A2X41_07300 [Candidatus Margulisbacteria bacterium GWE2_39_32]PZM77206.1 MAG: hypothetical protein DKM50_13825 [Candidatus Margulisiibacteriota bacterium]HAR63423.1 hypothetical protein [Candidatus Margulisiibacteriota bacterium]